MGGLSKLAKKRKKMKYLPPKGLTPIGRLKIGLARRHKLNRPPR
jgi:hypothetical protein